MLLNLDAGELDTETEELWSLFDVLACACGGHAGDAISMARVAAFCARSAHGSNHLVRLGAHPSYPDRAQFGRRSMTLEPRELARQVAAQCGALAEAAATHGIGVLMVKPHGALYHDAARDPAIAGAVVHGAIAALGDAIVIIGPATGALATETAASGLPYLQEGFADRRMRADGSLVPRSEPDALILDPAECAAQARRLLAHVDTICVHGDTPNAIAIARAVREVVHA